MEYGLFVRRHPFRLPALALLAAFLFFGVAGQQRGRAATGSGEAIGGIGAWRIGNPDFGIPESTQLLGRYSVVVINAYESSLVPMIKAESPGTRVLMYTSAIDIQQDCDTASEELTCATGITMYEVNSNDSSWILRDASGNRIVNAQYPYYYAGDIGSASYQSKWVSHVTTSGEVAWLRRCLDRWRAGCVRGARRVVWCRRSTRPIAPGRTRWPVSCMRSGRR